MNDHWVPHDKMDIPLGASRYGGCVVDLPPDVALPAEQRFAGQLDLATIAPHVIAQQLPKSGQLLFFADIRKGVGSVIYRDVRKEDLVRTIVPHDSDFFRAY